MGVRDGCKKTDVGEIPIHWDTKSLGEIATVSAGGTPSRANPRYWDGDIPWITTSEVDYFTIEHSDRFISKDGMNNSSTRLHQPGTVLMAMIGQGKTRGKVGMLGIKATTNQNCAAISLNQGFSPEYVYYYLASQYEAIRNLSNSGGQQSLNGQLVRSILLPVPPLPEQRAIATALSDMDALIAGLDNLITKKRDIKQAAMQQLLTGKVRLPGFSAKWQRKRLGELGQFSKGRGIKKDQVIADGHPCIRYGEIYTTHHDHIRHFVSFISTDIAKQSQRLRTGDLLFTGSGETAEEIGKCVAFLGKVEAYAGGDIVILSPNDSSSLFLGYLMNHSTVVVQKSRMGQGDAVVHISATNLNNVEVSIPTKEEQEAIASTISDMDSELAALEQRRVKTHDLKQGMMQELLTGKTRLI